MSASQTGQTERTVETAKGTTCRVVERGEGDPVLYLHGAGLLAENPMLDRLASRYRVLAPEWPGYGQSVGEDLLEDMLDFTLHASDLIESLDLGRPHVVGHSMGGMIAAELACVSRSDVRTLTLIDSAGLWIDETPIPDMFSFLPFEFAEYLFHDSAQGVALLTGGVDFSSSEALTDFLVGNSRRLGTAGKILFPIPNRRLSKRLYRLRAPTLVVWGESDKLVPPVYAQRWKELIPHAEVAMIPEAGHMAPYEQPEAVADAILSFLGSAGPQ